MAAPSNVRTAQTRWLSNAIGTQDFTNHPVCAVSEGECLLMAQPPLPERGILMAASSCPLEGHAVVNEEIPVLVVVVPVVGVVPDAVTDVQQAVARKCEGHAGREVAEAADAA